MFPIKEMLAQVMAKIAYLTEEATSFEKYRLEHGEEPRSEYEPNRGLDQIRKEINELATFQKATEVLSCCHDDLRHFCEECRMDEQADAAEYDMVHEYPLLKPDYDGPEEEEEPKICEVCDYIADNELVTCNDCRKKFRHDQVRHWKKWDFSTNQGDMPHLICCECWKLHHHQQRMKKDREAEEAEMAEMDEDTARRQAEYDEEHI